MAVISEGQVRFVIIINNNDNNNSNGNNNNNSTVRSYLKKLFLCIKHFLK